VAPACNIPILNKESKLFSFKRNIFFLKGLFLLFNKLIPFGKEARAALIEMLL
jgi:hypothetical protein